jgi:hypothetical protein
VAARAGYGDIAAVDRRIRVGDRLDQMTAMAIPAYGRFGNPSLQASPAVNAVGISDRAPAWTRIRGLQMAGDPAGRGRKVLFGLMGRRPLARDESGVAAGAGQRRVDRALEGNVLVAAQARRRIGRDLTWRLGGRRERRRGAKKRARNDFQLSSIQGSKPPAPE